MELSYSSTSGGSRCSCTCHSGSACSGRSSNARSHSGYRTTYSAASPARGIRPSIGASRSVENRRSLWTSHSAARRSASRSTGWTYSCYGHSTRKHSLSF